MRDLHQYACAVAGAGLLPGLLATATGCEARGATLVLTGGEAGGTAGFRYTTIRPKKPTNSETRAKPAAKPMPVFSPTVSGRPTPAHGAGPGEHEPRTASSSGTANIASIPYTSARLAMK